MICRACQKPMFNCVCPNLKERLDAIRDRVTSFTPEQWKALYKQAAANKAAQAQRDKTETALSA